MSASGRTVAMDPAHAGDLVDILVSRAAVHGDRIAFSFAGDEPGEEHRLSYAELDRQARSIAVRLREAGAADQPVLLLYAPGLDYIAAFFGCLYAGAIAVPVFPPRPNRSMARLDVIVADAGAKVALTHEAVIQKLRPRLAEDPVLRALHWIATDGPGERSAHADWRKADRPARSPAFLQYTSGSTGMPKGVVITHERLMRNSEMIRRAFQTNEDSHGVFWLPPYHDMGLIGGIVEPIYCGGSSTLMSPMSFVQNPFRWLEALSRTRASIGGGPDFAYALCCRKIGAEQRELLDLSHWTLAFNGAETIRPETLEQFAEIFGPCGFRRTSFYPCYGLAEATLIVSGADFAAGPRFCTVDAAALHDHRVVATEPPTPRSRVLVSSGHAVTGLELLIVDPASRTRCAADRVGEIWLAGPSIAGEYWRRDEETASVFAAHLAGGEGPYLRTGDLGFLRDAELYVTGRIKDLIIVRGSNFYPPDLESAIERRRPELQCSAAFAVEKDGEERVAIVVEVRRHRSDDLAALCDDIRGVLAERFGLAVEHIVLVKPGGIPRTTSGKLQRSLCRERWLAGELPVVQAWARQDVAPGLAPASPVSADPRPVSGETAAGGGTARADDLIGWLREYAGSRINSQLIDQRRGIPPYIVLDFGNRGILGMNVPATYDGIGLGVHDSLRVVEQLAAIDLTLAAFVGVNNVLGVRPILRAATDPMRERWLPRLARGRELAAFAITEPGAGSNPRAMSSRAVPAGGGWRLRGEKSWIGNGSWAGVVNVFVRHGGERGGDDGISGFMIAQGTPGLRQGPEDLTMGMRGMVQNTLLLDDVAVTPADLLGAERNGFAVAQDAMLYGRLGLGAISVGGMKRCAQLMLRYAARREIGTGRLLDNPVTLVRMGQLSAAIAAVESLVQRVATLSDAAIPVPVEIFVACKMAGPEFLWSAADALTQLLGGRGYTENNIAPQLLRDARLLRIFEGPTETMGMFLGSSALAGAPELHAFLRAQLEAPAVSAALQRAVEDIAGERGMRREVFADPLAAKRWSAARIGPIAMWAILQASAAHAARQRREARFERAEAWARLHFDQAVAQALSTTADETMALDPAATAELVSSYAASIGDIEQTLASENRELDPLLRRERSDRGVVAGIDVGGVMTPTGAERRARSAFGSAEGAYPSLQFPNDAQWLGKGHERGDAEARSEDPEETSGSASDLAERARNGDDPAAATRDVEWALRTALAGALRMAPEELDTRRPLYKLGMDSLVAVEFKSGIAKAYGVSLPITRFLDGATLADIAGDVQTRLAAGLTPAAPVQEPKAASSAQGLSAGQKALWFLHQLAPGSSAYNVAQVLEIEGALDESALLRALQALVARHPALRTRFVPADGEPVQQELEQADLVLLCEDAGDLSPAALRERLEVEAGRPFDLAQAPLLRAVLFRTSGASQTLLLVLHHIIEDSWSLGVILRELRLGYAAIAAGHEPRWPDRPADFSDFVHWQAQMLAGDEGQQHWAYWKTQLQGPLPVLELPTDHCRPRVQSFRGRTLRAELGPDLVVALKRVAEAQGTTLYVTLLAGFFALLHQYSGQDDIVVGSPMIGRSRPEWRDVVGYFVNPVALRARLTGDPTFADLLRAVRRTTLEALEHQDFPLPLLVERLQPPRDPSRSPLFDVLFSVQKDVPDNLGLVGAGRSGATTLDFGAARLAVSSLDHEFAQFDLGLSIVERGDALVAHFQFNTDLFEAATIERMALHYRTLLLAAGADADQPVSRMPLLDAQETALLRKLALGDAAGTRRSNRVKPSTAGSPVDFSLFYFAATEGRDAGQYELLIEGAKFADRNGFTAVWTPERHFNAFGGLYPNPSVAGAALAMVTQHIRIRAGSVVLPLHHPIRVAEEWAVVDHLSHGRVDLAFATGWNEDDFVLSSVRHAQRKEAMFRGIETVRRLWRGEALTLPDAEGREVTVRIHPLPVQQELAFWIACSGNPRSFVDAGACGANVLTSLMLQSQDQLEQGIALYRRARAAHGHDPATGRVTLMLHAFLGEDLAAVRRAVQEPFTAYLASSVELWSQASQDLERLGAQDKAELLAYSFERYFQNSALFGTVASGLKKVGELKETGVDEFACLVDFGVATPSVLAALPLLSELRVGAQRAAAAPRATPGPLDAPQRVHDLIAARAATRTDAIAVSCGAENVSYGELERRAEQLARGLRRRGVRAGTLVGLMSDRCVDMVVALLAILKAGAAYVPLDPGYPKARLAAMIEDAGIRLLITQRAHAELAKAFEAETLFLDADRPEAANDPADDASATAASAGDELAYVIYTSGSTGRPKGVEVHHRAVVNVLRAFAAELSFGADDVLLAVTTLSFDIAALEIFMPLCAGGRVVLATRETAADGTRLIEALIESGATVMQATPATWQLLLLAGWAGSAHLRILCGGEALPAGLAAALRSRCGAVWNVYGPTETTIWSTCHRLGADEDPVPIGRPIANTEVWVLDEHLSPVPLGVPGELCIGGAGLARGYLRRPELTAECFVAPAFDGAPDRLYRTGDRVRLRRDGALEFLGRKDRQVKVSGHRIEPGEIEAALVGHPAILQAVVIVACGANREGGLIAYYVPRPLQEPDAAQLRAFLAASLPSFMIPAAFVALRSIPLTGNGKIDRSALPNQGEQQGYMPRVAPSTPVEATIAAAWQEFLGLAQVGVHDNFFDVGGHSLLLARVQNRLVEKLGLDIPLITLYQYPTIGTLAAHLAEGASGSSRDTPAVRAATRREALQRQRKRIADAHNPA